MKILELHLVAFGPFSDLRLDFSAKSSALHVIYGPNEAGKSTTLRAIQNLLYGIPHTTPDDHLHRGTDLRIVGLLSNTQGATAKFARRKGRGMTLLDQTDSAVDEHALKPFLGGIGEDLFRTMFGLNHETLRQGAEALLQGRGDVKESLFGAGLGGPWLHQVLQELRDEANGLFAPQAKTRPINEALKAFAETQKRIKDTSTLPSAWQLQKQSIAEAQLERTRLEEELRDLRAKDTRLRRAQRVLPLLDQRTALLDAQAALGDVVILPPNAPQQREQTEQRIADATAYERRLSHDIEALQERKGELTVPESLLQLGVQLIDDINERLGSHRKATVDLPRVRGELVALEDQAQTLLKKLGHEGSIEQAERLRLDVATEARIKRILRERAEVETKPRELDRLLGDRRQKLEQCRRRQRDLPLPCDPTPLRRAVSRARQQGNLEQRVRETKATADKLTKEALGQLGRLGLWSGPVATVGTLPLPLPETVDRFALQEQTLFREQDKARQRAAEIDTRRLEVTRELSALQRSGSVPTEADLLKARERREATWKRLLRTLHKDPLRAVATAQIEPLPLARADSERSLTDVYTDQVQKADAVADRLRREADRVARIAQLLAEQDALKTERTALESKMKQLGQQEASFKEAFDALWRPAGIEPLAPADMRGWLMRHAKVVAVVDQLRAVEGEIEILCAAIDEYEAELVAALDAVADGDSPKLDAQTLDALVDHAEQTLAAIDDTRRERQEIAQQIDQWEQEIATLERERLEHIARYEAWQKEWTRSVLPLGLVESATSEEATATLDALADLFHKVDRAHHERRRVEGMERDAKQFATDVATLINEHAPELEGLPADKAAEQLVKRYHKAMADRREHDAISQQLREKQREIDEHRARKAAAEQQLAQLFGAAGVSDMASLKLAEQRSQSARDLLAELRQIDGKLMEAGEGRSVATLTEQTAGLERDTLTLEIDKTEERLVEIEQEQRKVDMHLGSLKEGLERLRTPLGAADAAVESEACLARLRGHVERYVRVRLAAILLEREMERYRERNQGPILTRASALFQELTLGSFAGLKVGYGEQNQAVLLCVRNTTTSAPSQLSLLSEPAPKPQGREVNVDGLSEGTRDQLYLALRLASLEHHAMGNEPMPLVMDDILIHFDDQRARAALRVLGDMAQRTQILFFTHHARLLELAREAVPKGILHELRIGNRE